MTRWFLDTRGFKSVGKIKYDLKLMICAWSRKFFKGILSLICSDSI